MVARLVGWSAAHPWLVLTSALALALAGEAARRSLPRDVLPELSDPQLVLVADWMGHSASEVATHVTRRLTEALKDVPGTTSVRGLSMSGMSYVEVVFPSVSSLESARPAVLALLEETRPSLPPTVRLQVGPLASSLGWVFQYVLVDRTHGQTAVTLRRFQEEVLRPALARLPGVAEVASVGGEVEQLMVDVHSDRLEQHGLAFSDVTLALASALAATPPPTLGQLQALPLPRPDAVGPPPQLQEVATTRIAHDMPGAITDFAGLSPAVGAIIIARRDAHLSLLLANVHRTLDSLRRRLPPGVELLTVYDRSDVISHIQTTLLEALGEEVAVVALVLLLFLLHARSALVPLLTLPTVVLLTFLAMWALGVPATLMSLGGIGIALGLAVDADVVALEACHRRLETLQTTTTSGEERRAQLVAAAGAFGPAVLTSLLIAALSFLPVFAFTGETARLVRPLALTKTLVIASAALVSLTLAPALRDRLLRGRVLPEFANPLTRTLVQLYRPFVHFALNRPTLTLLLAGVCLLSCLPVATRLGGEFLPRVDEGDLLFMPTTLSGAPTEELAGQLQQMDRALGEAPEVASVFGKVGRADTATDPAPLSMAETTLRLRPRQQWPSVQRQRFYSSWAPHWLGRVLGLVWPESSTPTTAQLLEKLDHLARLPGWSPAWTAPARARMDMLATGIRTPVGIRVVARDTARLDELGARLRALALSVPGTRSAVFESPDSEAWLDFTADSGLLAARQVQPSLLAATVSLLASGGQLGELWHEGRPLRVRVTQDWNAQGAADLLRDVTVRSVGTPSQPVPLALLGQPTYRRTPAAVRTEGSELVAYVQVDVETGRDLLGYVEAAQAALQKAQASGEVQLGAGERIDFVGQYRLMVNGARRLRVIVPLVALSMLLLLYLQFRSWTAALLVLTSVPFALVGSLWTLYWLGYPLSAPVWLGLLSVAGLAMQTGVVMVVYIDDAFYRRLRAGRLRTREDIVEAHAEGTIRRLRPKLMTVTTMGVALLPLLWSQGAGAEVMRRIAAPMLGGLVTSAFLTLEVLPVLYTLWRVGQLKRAQRLGVELAELVGSAPPWL